MKSKVKKKATEKIPAKKAAGKKSSSGAKGYNPVAPARIHELLRRLNELYPDVTCALHHRNAWELLVATILSAQSTDVNVNRVTPGLFAKYPTVEAFAALQPVELESDIHSTGRVAHSSSASSLHLLN